MSIYSRAILAAALLLASSIVLADGIYNPGSRGIGFTDGINNVGASGGGGGTNFILLVDGSSRLLQTDGTSKVCRAGGC